MKKLTKEEFISRSKECHGDVYDYSNVLYINTDVKVEIICQKHGSFYQTPYHHMKGCGCPQCAIENNKKKYSKGTHNFIEECKNIHGDKYDYSKVEYVNRIEKVCIICPEHGDFYMRPSNHLKGQGCPECGAKTSQEKQRGKKSNRVIFSQSDMLSVFKKVHGDKYDYSKSIYHGYNSDISIICPKHGEFTQKVYHHANGCGCKKCAYETLSKHNASTTDEFISKAKLIHGDEYDYSQVNYVSKDELVTIICPKHGMFNMKPKIHLMGCKCITCSRESNISSCTKTTDEFIQESQKKYGDRFDYSCVKYVNAIIPVTVICKSHGPFKVKPIYHLSWPGCPKCNMSKLEHEVEEELIKNDITYVYQATRSMFPWLGFKSLDFYLPDFNVAIECQGAQHFTVVEHFGGEVGYKERVERDNLKRKLCSDNGIRLLYYADKMYDENLYTSTYDLVKDIKSLNV